MIAIDSDLQEAEMAGTVVAVLTEEKRRQMNVSVSTDVAASQDFATQDSVSWDFSPKAARFD